MSFLAPAIFHSNNYLISYRDKNDLPSYSSSAPKSQILITKNTEYPETEYHIWLKSYNDDFIFTELRNTWVIKDISYRDKNNGEVKPYKHDSTKYSKLSDNFTRKWKNDIQFIGNINDDSDDNNIVIDVDDNNINAESKKYGQNKHDLSNHVSDESSDDLSDNGSSDDLFDNLNNLRKLKPKKNIDKKIHDTAISEINDMSDDISDSIRTSSSYGNISNTHNITQNDIDAAFVALQSLHWRDKDEQIMNANVLKRWNDKTLKSTYTVMEKLAEDLYNAVASINGSVDALSDEEKNNFLFHVIAKGNIMYYQSIAEPGFCLYMLDQYQPLYTYMFRRINKIRTH